MEWGRARIAFSWPASRSAWSCSATNLVAGDSNGVNDVFVRDRQANTTTSVSLGPGGANANGGSDSPSISGDGRLVAFTSAATNLVEGDTNGQRDAFVFDRQSGVTTRASLGFGSVRRVRAKPKKAGKVLAQSPKAGSVRARGTKVKLVVGRR